MRPDGDASAFANTPTGCPLSPPPRRTPARAAERPAHGRRVDRVLHHVVADHQRARGRRVAEHEHLAVVDLDAADVEATREKRSQRRQTAPSATAARSTSPNARATPSADAPRE